MCYSIKKYSNWEQNVLQLSYRTKCSRDNFISSRIQSRTCMMKLNLPYLSPRSGISSRSDFIHPRWISPAEGGSNWKKHLRMQVLFFWLLWSLKMPQLQKKQSLRNSIFDKLEYFYFRFFSISVKCNDNLYTILQFYRIKVGVLCKYFIPFVQLTFNWTDFTNIYSLFLKVLFPLTVAPLGKTTVFESIVKVRFFSAK